jgi:glycosyltransferase involved in cell wall biosynthesis
MSRILHVLDRLTGAGPTRSLIATAQQSVRSGGHEHVVVTLRREAYPLAVARARAAGLIVRRALDRETLAREIADADIVQLHFWNSPDHYGFLRAAWPAHRLLVRVAIAGTRAPQVLIPALLDHADFTVVTAAVSLNLPAVRCTAATGRVELIEPVGDFDRLAGCQPVPHEGFLVGYVGTLNFAKMHPRFVSMCAGVRVPGARFVVCGAGGAEEDLAREARALGVADRFELRGFVEEVGSILETLDVFGYPLCEETYATGEKSVQEAMYVGVPPVVFPHGGLRDLVQDGVTGLVVETEDEYCRAVEYLYRHPEARVSLGRNARAWVREHRSDAAAARRLERLYARLMDEPKRSRIWPGLPADASPAEHFVEAMGDAAPQFAATLGATDREAERAIGQAASALAHGEGGVVHYRNAYPEDPHLRFWTGLVLRGHGRDEEARREFDLACSLGLTPARVAPYLDGAADLRAEG